jgi:thiol-disulfide isomerase/thioredoxin
MNMRSLLAVIVLISSTAFAETRVGDRAGDFSLKDLSGQTVKLSDLKGSVVLVDFWASWCEPCKKELPALDALAAKYPKLVIIGVNVDKKRENAEKTLKALSISKLRVLLDPDGATPSQYDLPKMPSSFVIDQKGIVKSVHGGFEDGDEKKVESEIQSLLK